MVGISVDSRHSHANWAADMGGISFPLLADFNPKGAVAQRYGVYLDQAGMTDRATILIDCQGKVRHASSVTPSGQRDIKALLELARQVAAGGPSAPAPGSRPGLSADATLYYKEGCRFCTSVLRAVANLHCENKLRMRNVTREPQAWEELDRLAGTHSKVPALVQEGKVLQESGEIIKTLARACGRGYSAA